MDAEKPPTERVPDAPARDDVKVATNRCPFCHADVSVERNDWCSCRSCQARHHTACWAESKRCGACGDERCLTAGPAAVATSRSLDAWGLGIGAFAGLLVLCGTFLSYSSRPSGIDIPFGPSFKVADAGLNLAGMLLTALVTIPVTLVGSALGVGALRRESRVRALALNLGILALIIVLTIASA